MSFKLFRLALVTCNSDQQNEALIQLAIEIKGKSFLVNDVDPHYDVNFHFNSLDVIG